MHRNLALAASLFLGFALLWRSYVPPTNAAEARDEDGAAEETKAPSGQETEKPARGTKVALLDLGAVYKVHRGFLDRTTLMKKEVEQAEEQMKARQNEVKSTNDKLEALAKTSDEYRILSEEISRAVKELKSDAELKKKEFMQREAKIYAEVYDDISAHLKKYAAAHQIDLVMRVNNSEMDRNDPQEVIRELNKSVIFHSGIDITADIIALVNGL